MTLRRVEERWPDAGGFIAALGVTMAAVALASYLPARRAATIDPMKTVKVE